MFYIAGLQWEGKENVAFALKGLPLLQAQSPENIHLSANRLVQTSHNYINIHDSNCAWHSLCAEPDTKVRF